MGMASFRPPALPPRDHPPRSPSPDGTFPAVVVAAGEAGQVAAAQVVVGEVEEGGGLPERLAADGAGVAGPVGGGALPADFPVAWPVQLRRGGALADAGGAVAPAG